MTFNAFSKLECEAVLDTDYLLIILLLIILHNYHALNLSRMLNVKAKGTIELCQQGQLLTGLFRFPHAGDDNLGNNN